MARGNRTTAGRWKIVAVAFSLLVGLVLANIGTAPATEAAESVVVLADFEGGAPLTFFAYNGGASGVGFSTEVVAETDPLALPDQVGDNEILSVGFNVTDFGGFGDDFSTTSSQDWTAFDGMRFWFNGTNSGAEFQVEIFDGGPNADGAERWDYTFFDNFTGWQLIDVPFASFTLATDFNPNIINSVLDLDTMWGYAFPIVSGTSTVKLDDISIYGGTPDTVSTLADFEGGAPLTFFAYNGGASGVGFSTEVVAETDPLALPDQVGDNEILSVGFNVTDFGGFGDDFSTTSSQDWTAFDGMRFWFNGTNSGAEFQVEIFDGGPNADGAERWDYTFFDNFTGWQLIDVPFASFTLATDFNPNIINSVLDLDTMWGYAFPIVSGTSTVKLDDISIYASGSITPAVGFATTAFSVTEGDVATVEVKLNVASPTGIAVDYTTSDGTATDPDDYTGTAGTLTFAAGDTSETFTVATVEDTDPDGNETVNLTLSSPVGATLGLDTATLTILDDDAGTADPSFDKRVIVDDFESGLPAGTDPNGLAVGFNTFQDSNPATSVAITTAPPPDPVPGETPPNNVLQLDVDVASFAGVTHSFENATADQWVTQDWSRFEGVSFWMNGNNSGANVFIDILDNRNPGSTVDDAERFSITFADDFLGWRYLSIPFADFARKEIGNGAPNDGLNLTEMHGWAIGTVSTPGAQTFLVDDFAVVVREVVIDDFESGLPAGTDSNGISVGFLTFSDGSPISVATTDTPPAPAPAAPLPNNVLQMDSNVSAFAGFSHNFENAALDEWVTQDWSSFEGISLWMYGAGNGAALFFDVIESRNPGSTVDDAERYSVSFTDDTSGWRFLEFDFGDFSRKDINNGAPNDGFSREEVHGYAFGSLASGGPQTQYLDDVTIFGNNLSDVPLEVRFLASRFDVTEGGTGVATVTLTRTSEDPVSVDYATSPTGDRQDTEDLIATPDRDYAQTSGTITFAPGETEQTFEIATLDDDKWEVEETAVLTLANPVGADFGSLLTRASLRIIDDDPRDPTLIDDFETFPYKFEADGGVSLDITEIMDTDPMAIPGQTTWENVLTTAGDGSLTREFEQPVDWSGEAGVSVWVYGTDSGEDVGVELLDNRQPAGSPADWEMVWADEFNAPAGTPADPANWTYETGGWGWGNDEFQYYTDSTNNAAHDGAGNMVITVEEVVDPAAEQLPCWYGDCTHTSARLISEAKQDFAYGRFEARAKVPQGTGIWPAIWSLGNDFREVRWPQTGEIDVMEFVGRLPDEVFGTIHGPGYSGGQAWFGKIDIGEPVYNEYHTFTVDWQPNDIKWYIDGVQYHSGVPADVAPNEWVFDHPFFLLLNVAVGGNFGGPIGPDLTFPAELAVDYIRVYQAPDTSERFEATIRDNFSGWKQVEIPFSAFTRSADQPAGAPDDGLTLTEVWGYGVEVTDGGPTWFDQVRTEAEIELPTPRSQKTQAHDDLQALYPTGDKQTDQRLAKAIQRIDTSLDDRYWASDTDLDERRGYHVFRLERQAANELMKITKRGGEYAEEAQAAIDLLVAADQALAQAAIDTAIAGDGNGRLIHIAEWQADIAADDVASGRYGKAILRYGLAWRFAIWAF